MSGWTRLGAGIALSGAAAGAGYRRRALSPSGAAAAVMVGTAIHGFGGAQSSAVVVAFFGLSSALSGVGRARKTALTDVAAKGSRRDAGQVLANGGVSAALALLGGTLSTTDRVLPAFLGSLAAVTGDTWSTELGALSDRAPRSILSGRTVLPGASGGVTALGFGAALAGGVAVGLIAALARRAEPRVAARLTGLGAGCGLLGSVVDSLLGATVQRLYRCPRCGVETELTVHRCGTATVPVRGIPRVDNDVVNLLASLVGAVAGELLGAATRDKAGCGPP